ncbi:hypothetical protein C0J52_27504 [Blattella germanica]|nr:hypothetical protein C0J52_27504 [Blattella germanica]
MFAKSNQYRNNKQKNLTIWSDNCSAQNKNRVMVFLCLFLVAIGLFVHIEQCFLLSGHSFLQCDSDFALIEKRKRVTKAFIPSDLFKIVQESKAVKPFQVVPESDFLHIQQAADQLISTKNLNISKTCSIEYDAGKAGSVSVKQSHDAGEVRTIKMLKKGGKKT